MLDLPPDPLHCPTRAEWRAWLDEHHEAAREVWLAYYKKGVPKPSVTYADSVVEAICFGWIDGLTRRIDEERYACRFTPRRPRSKWTDRNIEIAQQMIAEHRMSPFGFALFQDRQVYDPDFVVGRASEYPGVPPELAAALAVRPLAAARFEAMPPSHRKMYALWVASAKKPETRERRGVKAAEMMESGKAPGGM